ncbi:hypothetical protein LZ198_41370 [Myxococcus sp. K15C18031901]|uniref:hypothetical protein n=1 Tax=Myxococcus dinghuensis TaxID=2906761 RepID=UPI0020A814C6|nr:hypothetical protein [Myxococcus dinghuensis]MCP3105336.1 hypothetical protein [Myxococcus dinghuensis]
MFIHWDWAVVLLLLLPGKGWAQQASSWEEFEETVRRLEESISDTPAGEAPEAEARPEEDALVPTTSETAPPWTNVLRMEASTLTLLPRRGAGSEEGFVQLEPMVALAKGEWIQLVLGAQVRLRLWGGGKGASPVRKEDWDTLSDWGQLLRLLTVADASLYSLWAGTLEDYSLISGHLVRRYRNSLNPDYHPAGVVVTGALGPLYAEAFTSDVFAARLVGAEVALDVQHVLLGKAKYAKRYVLSVSVAHDWGKAAGTSKPLTLAHLNAMAVVFSRRKGIEGLEVHLLGGWGGRPGEGGAWGAVAGVGVESVSAMMDLRGRLEGRRQHGGFRQGAFGPDYELARFQVAGPVAGPLADAPFPDGYSAYGEVILSWDAERLMGMRQRHVRFSMGVEAFNWGRVDVDGRLEVQLFHRNLSVGVGGLATGMGDSGARYLVSGDVRWRFLGGKLFLLGQGGTLLYPEAAGTLKPGAFAGMGLGVDNVR